MKKINTFEVISIFMWIIFITLYLVGAYYFVIDAIFTALLHTRIH